MTPLAAVGRTYLCRSRHAAQLAGVHPSMPRRRRPAGCRGMIPCMNEIGMANARGCQNLTKGEADDLLRQLTRKATDLPAGAVMSVRSETCPACGGNRVMWGCDNEQTHERDRLHPLVWHETEWMADTFLCRDCHAGWIEPDDPEPITWVRPYWVEAED